MKYKKNKYIIQVLQAITLFTVIFCYGCFYKNTTAHASLKVSGSENKPVKNKTDKGIKMNDKSQLTEKEGEFLLALARKTIEARLFNKELQSEEENSDKYQEKRGTFVTLTTGNHNLRGCIGHILPQESLIDGIKTNAINAAFKDPRFPPLSKDEWDDVRVEISILTEPVPLEYSGAEDLLDKLKPGIDGVIIKKGFAQAVFLPQVWDQLPDKEQFLSHLCMKAGLSSSEWQKGGLTVYIYQVQAFEEEH